MSEELKPELIIKSKVEALLFATDRPVAATKVAQIIGGTDARVVKKAIELLRKEYDEQARAFQIEEIADGYQLLTRPEFRECVTKLRRSAVEARLSQAALETLAIIAYRQPVLRARVEGVRGVQAGELLRGLMEKNLVKIVGRENVVGRPILYGTTRRFLEHFGLKSLKDLPKIEEVLPSPRKQAAPASQAASAPQATPAPQAAPAPPAAPGDGASQADAEARPETVAAPAPAEAAQPSTSQKDEKERGGGLAF